MRNIDALLFTLLLTLTLASASCTNPKPKPPVKGSMDSPTRSPPTTKAKTAAPRAKPSGSSRAWLTVDRSCNTNADCLGIYKMWADGQRCCRSCQTDAVAKRWIVAAERACAAAGSEGCPMKKCAALAKVECRQHHCQVKR